FVQVDRFRFYSPSLHLHSPLFSHATPPTATYTLSLHDALPICHLAGELAHLRTERGHDQTRPEPGAQRRDPSTDSRERVRIRAADRKSTRLNSSHDQISYAVFCLKKKKKTKTRSISSEII